MQVLYKNAAAVAFDSV